MIYHYTFQNLSFSEIISHSLPHSLLPSLMDIQLLQRYIRSLWIDLDGLYGFATQNLTKKANFDCWRSENVRYRWGILNCKRFQRADLLWSFLYHLLQYKVGRLCTVLYHTLLLHYSVTWICSQIHQSCLPWQFIIF